MIERYCECGDGIRLIGDESVLPAWQAKHDGRGHARVSANEARAIRMNRRTFGVRKVHASAGLHHPEWALCGSRGFGPQISTDHDAVTCETCLRLLDAP